MAQMFNNYRVKYSMNNDGVRQSVVVYTNSESNAKDMAKKEIIGCYGSELCKKLQILQVIKCNK